MGRALKGKYMPSDDFNHSTLLRELYDMVMEERTDPDIFKLIELPYKLESIDEPGSLAKHEDITITGRSS